MKRLVLVLSLLTVLLFSLTLYSSALTSGNFNYTVNSDGKTATITGYAGAPTGDLIIPSEIDGYKVTVIGDRAFLKCDGFTGNLVLPDKVKTIGERAFLGCSGFTGSLIIPNSVTTIGERAFNGCTGFTGALAIPDSITTIEYRTFMGCCGFTGDLIIPDSVVTIEEDAFYDCGGFTGDLIIGDSVTYIGESAFSHCSGFASNLVIPDSVTTIEALAFNGCRGFTGEFIIGGSVAYIGDFAFNCFSGIQKAIFFGDVPSTWGNAVFGDNVPGFTIYYIEGKKGWTTPTWTAPDGKIYNTAIFYPNNANVDKNVVNEDSVINNKSNNYEFSLKIVSAEDKTPISGATVVFDGQSVTTSSDGVAGFNKPTSDFATLSVSASNYTSVSTDSYAGYLYSASDTIELYKSSKKEIIPVTCNGKSLSTSTIQINNKADLYAEIELSSTVSSGNIKYTLSQGNATLGESTTGKFKIHNSAFKKGEDITATLYVNGSKVSTKKLNIGVVSFAFFPTGFPLGAETIQVPSDVKFFGGMEFELELGETEIKFEVTNDQIKFGFGKEKDKIDLSRLKDTLRDWLKEQNREFSSDIVFDIGGYGIINMGNNGIESTELQIILALKYKHNLGVTVTWMVPVRVEVGLSLEGQLIITTIGYDFDKSQIIFPDLDGKIKGAITLSAGIGCGFASVGIYGSAALEFVFGIIPELVTKSLTVEGQIGLYAKIKFLGRFEIPFISGKQVLYDKDRVDLSMYSLYDTSSMYNEMMYSLEISSASTWNSSVVDGILQTNVSGFADPVTVKADDSIVSVYLADDVTLDEHNSQQLVYSLFNGSGWSEPVSVDTNSLADGEYSLYSDGEDIYLAYTEAKRTLTEDDDATAKASAIEVVVCKFDKVNKIFTEHTVITNDTYFDTHPAVSVVNGIPTVAFVKNTDNNIFGMSENNALYVCQYIDGKWVTSVVSTKTNAATSLSLGSFDDKSYVVAGIFDVDSNFETTEDRYITLYRADGQTLLSPLGEYDNPIFESNYLYWHSNNAVYKMNGFDSDIPIVTDAISSDFAPDFDVLEDGSLLFRVYNVENENGGADLYVVKGNTLPVRITETGGYIDSFDALTVDGSILTLYRTTEVTYFDEYGFETVSNLESKYIEDFSKLEVTDVTYSDLDLFGDDTLTLIISVTNNGTIEENGFTLNVNNVSTTYSDILKPGETKEVTYVYTYPETPGNITVNVGDSEKSINVGYADFVVNSEDKIIAGDTHLSVTLTNEGNIKGEGTLTIKRDGENGAEIYSESLELGAKEQKYIMLEIIDETLENVYIEFTPEEADYYEGDNIAFCELIGNLLNIDKSQGDANLDGETDVLDLLLVKRYLSGKASLSSQIKSKIDFNQDGSVDEEDYSVLTRLIFK